MYGHPKGCSCRHCKKMRRQSNDNGSDDATSATTHVGPQPTSSQDESTDEQEEPNYECIICEYETTLSDHKKETQAWCDGDCECIRWFRKK